MLLLAVGLGCLNFQILQDGGSSLQVLAISVGALLAYGALVWASFRA